MAIIKNILAWSIPIIIWSAAVLLLYSFAYSAPKKPEVSVSAIFDNTSTPASDPRKARAHKENRIKKGAVK